MLHLRRAQVLVAAIAVVASGVLGGAAHAQEETDDFGCPAGEICFYRTAGFNAGQLGPFSGTQPGPDAAEEPPAPLDPGQVECRTLAFEARSVRNRSAAPVQVYSDANCLQAYSLSDEPPFGDVASGQTVAELDPPARSYRFLLPATSPGD